MTIFVSFLILAVTGVVLKKTVELAWNPLPLIVILAGVWPLGVVPGEIELMTGGDCRKFRELLAAWTGCKRVNE